MAMFNSYMLNYQRVWLKWLTLFIFHNIWDNPSRWLICFEMVKTTNQIQMVEYFLFCHTSPVRASPGLGRWGLSRAAKSGGKPFGTQQAGRWLVGLKYWIISDSNTGWWFGTFLIFHNIWDNPDWWFGTWILFSPIVGMMIQSDFHIFQGVETTNQIILIMF